MAINDEFSNASELKFDASGEYSSRSDASREFKREMTGKEESHADVGGSFQSHADASTTDVALRDATSDLADSTREAALRGLNRFAQGSAGTSIDTALRDFDKLDAGTAAVFMETLSGRVSDKDFEVLSERFELRFGETAAPAAAPDDAGPRGPVKRSTGEMAAMAAGDALIGSDEDTIIGASWRAGRTAQRVHRAVGEHGAGKGGAMAAAGAYLDEADDNVLTASRDAYRSGRAVQQLGRNIRPRRAANVSEASAKRKSMSIARATAAGEVTGEMSFAARLKAMAASAGSSIASAFESGMGGIAPLAASALPMLMPFLAVVLIAGSFSGVIGAIGSSESKVDGLTEVENQVYSFFREKGLDDLHVAAIMGNMKAESGANPANLQHVPGPDNSCPNEDILAIGPHVGGKAAGLFQWDMGRRHRLAQFARDTDRNWYEAAVQLEFFWDHDEWQGNWGSGQNTKSKFYATDDLATAVRIFCRGWERAGTEHLDTRVSYAQSYLDRFMSAKDGQPLAPATDAQKKVAAAARRQPAPAGSGWCAKWVSTAFQSAGQPRIGGNANDMFRSWCHSSDRSELKVGMIIAEDTSSHYGHVGIYVGDGKVLSSESNYSSNSSQIRERTVDEWVRIFGAKGPVRWGWANDIDLSA